MTGSFPHIHKLCTVLHAVLRCTRALWLCTQSDGCCRLSSVLLLQDTIRFWPLAVTMLGMSFRDPVVVTRVVRLVRPFSFHLGLSIQTSADDPSP